MHAWVLSFFCHVRLFETLWTMAHQAPLSRGISRQEYWSGLPCPPPRDLPDPGMGPNLLYLLNWQASCLSIVPPGKPHIYITKLLQSCPTLWDPTDGSPPGSAIPGILQARTLKWVAISFSNAWKWKVKVNLINSVRLFVTPWTAAYQAPLSMGFSRQSTGVGCHCLLRSLT